MEWLKRAFVEEREIRNPVTIQDPVQQSSTEAMFCPY
jgi:hypothetical protein